MKWLFILSVLCVVASGIYYYSKRSEMQCFHTYCPKHGHLLEKYDYRPHEHEIPLSFILRILALMGSIVFLAITGIVWLIITINKIG